MTANDAQAAVAVEVLRLHIDSGSPTRLTLLPDEARAILAHITSQAERIEALTAERDKLAGIVQGWHYLAVGPDEMGDYIHQRELIKASEPYAHPALKATASGAHLTSEGEDA